MFGGAVTNRLAFAIKVLGGAFKKKSARQCVSRSRHQQACHQCAWLSDLKKNTRVAHNQQACHQCVWRSCHQQASPARLRAWRSSTMRRVIYLNPETLSTSQYCNQCAWRSVEKKNTRVARSAQSTGVPSMCLAEPSPTGLRLPSRCLAERLKKKVRVNVFRGAVTNRLAINVPG